MVGQSDRLNCFVTFYLLVQSAHRLIRVSKNLYWSCVDLWQCLELNVISPDAILLLVLTVDFNWRELWKVDVIFEVVFVCKNVVQTLLSYKSLEWLVAIDYKGHSTKHAVAIGGNFHYRELSIALKVSSKFKFSFSEFTKLFLLLCCKFVILLLALFLHWILCIFIFLLPLVLNLGVIYKPLDMINICVQWVLVALIILGPSMSIGKSSNLQYAPLTFVHVNSYFFIPFWCVSLEMHLYWDLCVWRIWLYTCIIDLYNCCFKPFAHLVKDIYSIVYLKSLPFAPLPKNSALFILAHFCFDPLIIFCNKPCIVYKHSIAIDLAHFCIAPLIYCI